MVAKDIFVDTAKGIIGAVRQRREERQDAVIEQWRAEREAADKEKAEADRVAAEKEAARLEHNRRAEALNREKDDGTYQYHRKLTIDRPSDLYDHERAAAARFEKEDPKQAEVIRELARLEYQTNETERRAQLGRLIVQLESGLAERIIGRKERDRRQAVDNPQPRRGRDVPERDFGARALISAGEGGCLWCSGPASVGSQMRRRMSDR